MDNHNQETGNIAKYVWGFLAGLLVGGLGGAGAMLLLTAVRLRGSLSVKESP
jgi:uncharacterized membrane protein YfcA